MAVELDEPLLTMQPLLLLLLRPPHVDGNCVRNVKQIDDGFVAVTMTLAPVETQINDANFAMKIDDEMMKTMMMVTKTMALLDLWSYNFGW